jgi:hypothetical protein
MTESNGSLRNFALEIPFASRLRSRILVKEIHGQ